MILFCVFLVIYLVNEGILGANNTYFHKFYRSPELNRDIHLSLLQPNSDNFTNYKAIQYTSKKGRIIGGHIARIENFPSIAFLILKNAGIDEFRGGAVIVGDYWAVTAAHCMLYISGDDVEAGKAYVFSSTAYVYRNYKEHLITERYVHEQFDVELIDFDIALLKVKNPFTGRYEKPIKFAWEDYEYVDLSMVTVVGWGMTDPDGSPYHVERLRYVNTTIMNFETCRARFNEFGETLTNQMMCAGEPGKDACIYDSGGPLYQNDVLIGIVSWGSQKCGSEYLPGVYTKVSLFHKWIFDNMERRSKKST